MQLTLIGTFAVTQGGQPLTVTPAGARLLALLALHRRGLTRACVGGILWPDKSEDRASANLRSALWRLKATRSIAIIDREPAVLCLSPHVEADVDRIGGWLGSAPQTDDEHPNVDLLLRNLLQGWDDPWVTPFSLRWRQTRLHAIDVRCRQLIEQRRFNEAVGLADRVLSVEPLRESLVRLLVEARLCMEHPVEAAAAISNYRARLGEELGAKPSSQLLQLAEAIGRE